MGNDVPLPPLKRACTMAPVAVQPDNLSHFIKYLCLVAVDEKFEDLERSPERKEHLDVVRGAHSFETWVRGLAGAFADTWTSAVRRDLTFYCMLSVTRVPEVPTAACSVCGTSGLHHRVGWVVSLSSPIYVCEDLWARVRPAPGSRPPVLPKDLPPAVNYLAGSECAGKMKTHHSLLHLKYNLLGSAKGELKTASRSLKPHRRTVELVIGHVMGPENAWLKNWRRHVDLLAEIVEDFRRAGKKRMTWTDVIKTPFPPTMIHNPAKVEPTLSLTIASPDP